MWKILLIFVVLMFALDGATSENSNRQRRSYASGYAGGYAGAGAGGYAGSGAGGYAGSGIGNGAANGGYISSYSGLGNDYDDYSAGHVGYGGVYGGPVPNFGYGFIDPYLFHQQLTQQIYAQHQATQHQINNQIAAQNRYNYNSAGAPYNIHRYAPNYAVASGSIGPKGYKQTAYISPPNPAVPNIVNRFGGEPEDGASGTVGGYKGISVSSYSSSNSDGTGTRGAHTTVNDNGKVTHYAVHS